MSRPTDCSHYFSIIIEQWFRRKSCSHVRWPQIDEKRIKSLWELPMHCHCENKAEPFADLFSISAMIAMFFFSLDSRRAICCWLSKYPVSLVVTSEKEQPKLDYKINSHFENQLSRVHFAGEVRSLNWSWSCLLWLFSRLDVQLQES